MLEILFCLIVGISDGDTLKARCGDDQHYEEIPVKIVAIDAPEIGQPFGSESQQNLSALCFEANAEIAIYHHDKYGRIIGDVRCNGKDAGREQVKAGMAWVDDEYAEYNHKHLYALQEKAKTNGLGLWSDKEPIAP